MTRVFVFSLVVLALAAGTATAGRATNPLRHNDIDLTPGTPTALDARSALTLGPITLRVEVSPVELGDADAAGRSRSGEGRGGNRGEGRAQCLFDGFGVGRHQPPFG
jgi:hypothetical protein